LCIIRIFIFVFVVVFLPVYARADVPFVEFENRYSNTAPFTKWWTMIGRMDAGTVIPALWRAHDKELRHLPLRGKAEQVNRLINQFPYISDSRNYGLSDYWAAPHEFLKNGGDCEDFAIAKYGWLRHLDVAENHLRLAIVDDLQRDRKHAVLLLQDSGIWVVLDNNTAQIHRSDKITRYRLIYSINREAWWLPVPAQHKLFVNLLLRRGGDEFNIALGHYLNALLPENGEKPE